MLTNLSTAVTAAQIADLYHRRWTIETAFQKIEALLKSEDAGLPSPARGAAHG